MNELDAARGGERSVGLDDEGRGQTGDAFERVDVLRETLGQRKLQLGKLAEGCSWYLGKAALEKAVRLKQDKEIVGD